MRKYRIVWADDEIDDILDTSTQETFQDENIDVVKFFTTSRELISYLNSHAKDADVDAVIVDANFPYEEWKANQERDVSGLIKVSLEISRWRGTIPFILYTGRLNLIQDDEDGLFEYFLKNNQYIQKDTNGIDNLIKKIKELVDRKYSPERIIKEQYSQEIEYLRAFDKICKTNSEDLLVSLLVASHENKIKDAEHYFNDIRSILERINDKSAELNITPKLSLNNFSKLICKDKVSVGERDKEQTRYELIQEVMPKALSLVFEFLVRTTQDGSHSGNNAQKSIREYVTKTKDTLMIRSVLYETLLIIKWFMQLLCNNLDNLSKTTFYTKESIPPTEKRDSGL